MPPPVPDAHLEAQAALADQLAPLSSAVAADIDPSDIAGSVQRAAVQVQALRLRYGRASQALAIGAYRKVRTDAGLGPVRLNLPPVDDASVQQAVAWAFRGLYGPLNDEPVTIDGKSYQPIADRLADAETNLTGVVDKLVMDEGRGATFSFIDQDRKARGWARVPEADPCAWCALLATRGAVYKEDTIKFNAAGKFNDTTEFGGHDHCRCQPLPVFFDYQKPQRVLDWETLYSDSIEYRQDERPTSRTTGKPLTGLAAFRRLYDAQGGKPLD